ncbi:50S ribosomal protein L19 [Thermodesulfobium narugense DSM 14796]|uniref:Large ribosomal subunit protein bL19 n=1 Tax=Thermodesulfobium narugense DSM 14796 TaxID=747365 RepID=M1E7E5_9BACT|nr:50S ribosomal protein L19 [Thermodesulfobium narugense]AEE14613.1 50S ribosomal protein L19 [Thermodesulfobium narugense DSM 14796]
MSQELIKKVESKFLKETVPTFNVGDTVKVYVKVKEGEKERTQVFEGIVIAKKNGGLRESFVVRKVSYGVGVEKSFMLHSPNVEKVEVIRKGKAKKAKLYYLRDKIGKLASHVKEKF